MLNLGSIGMERGFLYETIITTKDERRIPNAAPIGVLCKGDMEVVIFLYIGSLTSKNIRRDHHFVVNILRDPLLFVESTISNPPISSFDSYKHDFYIKNTDAFFTATVNDVKDVTRKDELGTSTLSIIKAQVDDIIIKKDFVEPLNRAIFAVIEALIYLTRMRIADDDTSKLYSDRISEMSRIVNRVGGPEHKKAMKTILKALNPDD
jgi:uncharacterized protein